MTSGIVKNRSLQYVTLDDKEEVNFDEVGAISTIIPSPFSSSSRL